MAATIQSDVVIAGGGLAGIVAALEALRAGKSVALVDRDTPERFGGLALWAFGGMALVGTPLQARMKIPDTPERALAEAKLNEAETIDDAIAWLHPKERMVALHDRALIDMIARLPDTGPALAATPAEDAAA